MPVLSKAEGRVLSKAEGPVLSKAEGRVLSKAEGPARSTFVAAACLLAACGFSPQDEFTGQRAGDGIAPWADLGPVQICFGNEFLGPPTSEPGGLCSQPAAEAPCTSGDDCRSRESCVCGRCTVQYCTVNSDCGAGRICSFDEKRCDRTCARDDDCPLADICFNGTCRGQCETDLDCQTGEVCNSLNRCITAACTDAGDCLGGERCVIQRIPRVAREPMVVARSSSSEPAFTMWLEMSSATQLDERAIWRATSSDGVHFVIDPARPVVEDGDDAHAPTVVRLPMGGFAMYYEQGDGNAIRYTSSVDGVSFGTATTVLDRDLAGVRAPSAVVLPDGTVAVYFEIGLGAAVGLATGQLGGQLARQEPPLTPSDVVDPPDDATDPAAQFWVDIERMGSPHAAITVGPKGAPSLRVWFSAFGRESGDSYQFGEVIPIPSNYSIGYASADVETPGELTIWPYNPVLDRVEAFTEHRSELSPAAVQVTDRDGTPRGGYLLYYLDAEAADAIVDPELNRIGVAGNGSY